MTTMPQPIGPDPVTREPLAVLDGQFATLKLRQTQEVRQYAGQMEMAAVRP